MRQPSAAPLGRPDTPGDDGSRRVWRAAGAVSFRNPSHPPASSRTPRSGEPRPSARDFPSQPPPPRPSWPGLSGPPRAAGQDTANRPWVTRTSRVTTAERWRKGRQLRVRLCAIAPANSLCSASASPKSIPAFSTCGRIPPSPHRSEIMTSGWCGETGVPWKSFWGGTGRTGGEPRARIRNFVRSTNPPHRRGEASPFCGLPASRPSLAGAASYRSGKSTGTIRAAEPRWRVAHAVKVDHRRARRAWYRG
jgi:hypothetical protein